MATIPSLTPVPPKSNTNRLIVTIAVYGPTTFQISQHDFFFTNNDEVAKAKEHYLSEAFRKNIEGGGAFVKVDAYQV